MNDLHDEFEGIDYAWIAVDSLGQIAVFTTGGEGPIPATARPGLEDTEDLVDGLSESSDMQVPPGLEEFACFTAFARRGLFAYDWSDVHRSTSSSMYAYELMARPTEPLMVEKLPDALRHIASRTKLVSTTFGSTKIVVDLVAV